MLKITKPRERKTVRENRIEFMYISDPGAGYSFDADNDWNPIFHNECQEKNYNACLSDKEMCGPLRRTYDRNYIEPAQGICRCGQTISLTDQYMGACECPKCGQWYNLFGQEVYHPTGWDSAEF